MFKQRLTGAHGQAELSHFEERLGVVLGRALLPLTIDLLSEAALSDGLSHDAAVALSRDHAPGHGLDDLREILDVLVHDGCLRLDDDGRHRFVSRLVHEWWRQRYQLSYVRLQARSAAHVA